MKELSIEEKAKRYDQAIKVAKSKIKNDKDHVLYEDDVIEMFPELKESEDERIKEDIITYLSTVEDKDLIPYESWINWLEKQGETFTKKDVDDAYLKGVCDTKHEFEKQCEQKPADKVEPKFKIGDTIRNKITNEVFTIINRCISLEYYYDINHLHEVKFSEQDNWELVEQKPADKVERKFKVGNWIVNQHGTVRHIKEVDNAGYQTDKGWLTHENYEKNFHLWTIQDAKDGDVLYINNTMSESIMIYKSFNNGIINKYASYNKFGFEGENYLTLNDGYVCPATKEQRDTLMKAMADAGYIFDFEKKELKKIEQNPAWSEEDEIFVHGLIRGLAAKRDIHGHTTFSSDCIDITETINWLKSLKNRVLLYPVSVEYNEEDIDNIADTFIPEPVWNALEESEGEGSNAAAYDYSQMIAMFKAGIHWLKSLKERVQPQPKQEWSEEDKKMIESCIFCFEKDMERAKSKFCESDVLPDIIDGYKKKIDFLKSLRPQNRWKPSDEQMNALDSTLQYSQVSHNSFEYLNSLYNDLKKLREE